MHVILAEDIRSFKFRGIEQNELGRTRLIDSTSVNISQDELYQKQLKQKASTTNHRILDR
jgi:hypothetical protein